MKYDNSTVRRQDRLLDEKRAVELLHGGEYGFLAMTDGEAAYAIPMSYAVKGDCIYSHSAPDGEKFRFLGHSRRVSFTVVGKTAVQPSKFTTLYESVIAFGEVRIVESDAERRDALELLLDKYSPDDKVVGMKYAGASLPRTALLCLKVERWSGKSKGGDF